MKVGIFRKLDPKIFAKLSFPILKFGKLQLPKLPGAGQLAAADSPLPIRHRDDWPLKRLATETIGH